MAAYSKSKAPSIPIQTRHHFRVDTATGSGRCPPLRWLVWGGLRYRLEQNARALPSDRQVDDRNRPLGSEACKPSPDPMLSHGAGHRMTAVQRLLPVAGAGRTRADCQQAVLHPCSPSLVRATLTPPNGRPLSACSGPTIYRWHVEHEAGVCFLVRGGTRLFGQRRVGRFEPGALSVVAV